MLMRTANAFCSPEKAQQKPYSLSSSKGEKAAPECLLIRERVGEPQRAEGISGHRHLPDVAGVQDREHGKLPPGWEGEWNVAQWRR